MKYSLLSCFFFAFFVGFSSLLHATTAPASIIGKKFTLSFLHGNNTFTISFLTEAENYWMFQYENGDWQSGSFQWETNGNSATFKEIPHFPNGEYFEIDYLFSGANSGTYTLKFYKPNNSGSFDIDGQASGTFSLSDYSTSDLPLFDTFFFDDFTSVTATQNYWYDNVESPWYGLQFNVGDGELELTGTGTDPDELWFDANTKSLISVDKDWIIQADAYANYPATGSETWNAKVGFEMEDSGLDFEFFIGPSGWGTHAHLNFDDSLSGNVHLSTTFDSLKQGTYRIRNDTSSKTFYAETLSGSTWNTVMSVNWETGAVSGATHSSSGSTSQLSNWVSMTSKYVQPGLDFMIPSDSGTVKTLSENQLGFDSFSITAASTEPDPEYAPSSLAGMIYQGSSNDTYQFIDESNAIFYHQESNFQSSEVSGITYTWSPNGSSGTLTTSLDETTTLSFTSASEGTFQWQENGGSSSSGSFTLSEASAGYAPSILAGDSMIAGTTTYVFKENGVVTIRSNTGSQDSTYGFVKSENNEIVFSIPAHGNSVSSTLYKMTFSSTGAGTLSEGGSGSFQYFIDGSNQPSSKGWMWFDSYPWVYSSIEQDWIYFYPTSSTLMVYSSKDQAWREMVE